MSQRRSPAEQGSLFEGYAPLPSAFDEFVDAQGRPHPAVAAVVRRLDELGRDEFRRRKKLADTTFLRGGVTFSVYSGASATERIFPFDLIPRVVAASEWTPVRRGLEQRIHALNLFLADVYGDQRILDEGRVPRALVEGSKGYCKAMRGVRPPGGVYIHIAGIDLIRDASGAFLVLEDNVRTPSGVSYVLENRDMMKKVFPAVLRECAVAPVEMYPTVLREAMAAVAPRGGVRPRIGFWSGRYSINLLGRNRLLSLGASMTSSTSAPAASAELASWGTRPTNSTTSSSASACARST